MYVIYAEDSLSSPQALHTPTYTHNDVLNLHKPENIKD